MGVIGTIDTLIVIVKCYSALFHSFLFSSFFSVDRN